MSWLEKLGRAVVDMGSVRLFSRVMADPQAHPSDQTGPVAVSNSADRDAHCAAELTARDVFQMRSAGELLERYSENYKFCQTLGKFADIQQALLPNQCVAKDAASLEEQVCRDPDLGGVCK